MPCFHCLKATIVLRHRSPQLNYKDWLLMSRLLAL